MADVRDLLASAQAAEARGDKNEAIAFLRRAAEVYRDSQNAVRAMKMLRHIRRLEGFDEEFEDVEAVVASLPDAQAPGESEPEPARRPPRVLEERAPTLAPPELEAWCSFCCKPKREVGPLVAGPTGTFICASCTGRANELLSGFDRASVRWTTDITALPHQREALKAISRQDAKVALLMGPAGSGRTTLLAAFGDPITTKLDLEAPLTALPNAKRVVIAVRAQPPPPPLVIAGRPVYDTATLVSAVGSFVPEAVLARVDSVGVLPPFDAASLRELAEGLGVKDAADQLVSLALKAPSPAHELRALIARLA